MVNTAEQQNKSANKNKYKILRPLDATKNVIKDNRIIIYFDNFKQSPLNLTTFFPSTMIKLDIALINVSMLLIVKEIARIRTIMDNPTVCSFNKR